jgi:hypothetical protein
MVGGAGFEPAWILVFGFTVRRLQPLGHPPFVSGAPRRIRTIFCGLQDRCIAIYAFGALGLFVFSFFSFSLR